MLVVDRPRLVLRGGVCLALMDALFCLRGGCLQIDHWLGVARRVQLRGPQQPRLMHSAARPHQHRAHEEVDPARRVKAAHAGVDERETGAPAGC